MFTNQIKILIFTREFFFCQNCELPVSFEIVSALVILFFLGMHKAAINSMLGASLRNPIIPNLEQGVRA